MDKLIEISVAIFLVQFTYFGTWCAYQPENSIYKVVSMCWKIIFFLSPDRKKCDKLNLDDPGGEWEVKTITSALKNYFRYKFIYNYQMFMPLRLYRNIFE